MIPREILNISIHQLGEATGTASRETWISFQLCHFQPVRPQAGPLNPQSHSSLT